MKASEFPRPANDNGWGVHADANAYSPHWNEDLKQIKRMGLKWVKVVADGGSQMETCKKLLAAGIFPIVRLWRDRPNPGLMNDTDREAVRKYIEAGVKYFETNNEPNLPCEWVGNRLPSLDDVVGSVVSNFHRDAEFILNLGGFPLFPAMAPTHTNDPAQGYPMNTVLVQCMKKLDKTLFTRGALFAVHNAGFNHDLDGQDVLADPCWWNSWRVPILYAEQFWGFPVGVIATEGGFSPGQWDRTYPENDVNRILSLYQQAYTRMLHEDPYFIAICPWILRDSTGAHDPKAVWLGPLKSVMDMIAGLPKTPRVMEKEPDEPMAYLWNSPNFMSRRGLKPTHIVLHDTEGDLRATYHWFMNPEGVSTHLVVDKDGSVYRAVSDDQAAYGAGYAILPGYNWAGKNDPYPSPNANYVTLHLELIAPKAPAAPDYTDAQLSAAAKMVVFWMDKYGIPLERVVCHKDIDGYGRRTDPRDWDHGKFLRFVMGEETRDKYLSRIKEIIEEWQR